MGDEIDHDQVSFIVIIMFIVQVRVDNALTIAAKPRT